MRWATDGPRALRTSQDTQQLRGPLNTDHVAFSPDLCGLQVSIGVAGKRKDSKDVPWQVEGGKGNVSHLILEERDREVLAALASSAELGHAVLICKVFQVHL